MADESMNSDSSIDSVDESGKAFRKYLSQRRKDPNDASQNIENIIMAETGGIYRQSEKWARLVINVNEHIRQALLDVLHNKIGDRMVQKLPSDGEDLYKFLQKKKTKIENDKIIKGDQKLLLFPSPSQSVDSSKFDVSVTRYLIRAFCGIKNAKGGYDQPDSNDKTLFAFVFRAAGLRNELYHYGDIKAMTDKEFNDYWEHMKYILRGLQYKVDIEPERTKELEIRQFKELQKSMLQEFLGYLEDYRKESSNPPQEFYIHRCFSVDNVTEIVNNPKMDETIRQNDRVNIFAEAGLGKSVTARNIKYLWHKREMLPDSYLMYFDSKKINQRSQYHSFAAPIFFSELGEYLRTNKSVTQRNFLYFDCVTTKIKELVILIDGIDEFPIKDLVTHCNVIELENKVMNNKQITAAETITAIYFGLLFPNSKVILLGRLGEFSRLKEVNVTYLSTTSVFSTLKFKDLKLLKFDDANVKEFTCNKICNRQQNGQTMCTGECQKIYDEIKNIELCKIPTDLNSLIELHKQHPNKNIGRITRTKLIIATLFNRLTKHIYQKSYLTLESFREISEQKDLSNYLDCIRKLGEISFQTLQEDNITVKVEEKQGQFIYKEEIKVERKIFEELDLFYVRDFKFYYNLEPQHTLNIEFLSACYLFSQPEKWDSILELNQERQLVIISFIAGLHADYFTKDFVENGLNITSYSLEQFFSWLYDVEDVRDSLQNGGRGYDSWFGLMETQKLSPSFYRLDYISHEVEIPQTYIPKTIVCNCYSRDYDYDDFPSFEWYNMNYLKHNFLTKLSDKLNIESFLDKFPQYDFIIKGYIKINDNDEFKLLNKCGNNNRITFRINDLDIRTPLNTSFSSNFNVNTIDIGYECDSRTRDVILNALSPPTTNTSLSNPKPAINCKRLYINNIFKYFNSRQTQILLDLGLDIEYIYNIKHFSSQQTEKLFELGLSGVVDCIKLFSFHFFTYGQLALKNAERKANKMLNIEMGNQMFGLPNLANRHLSLCGVKVTDSLKVTDNDLIKLREHIIPTGYANNLTNFDKYKIIHSWVPFVRKQNSSQDRKQSMFFNFCRDDFRQVSPDVFVETFSSIPSLSCCDDHEYKNIPSSYWSRLSQINNCRLNEMRIWGPRPENFEHFLNIKTSLLQLVFKSKDELKGILNHIATITNIQLRKQIKVFFVKYDDNDWDYYEEIPVFSDKTIEEYKINHCSDDLLLDNISLPLYEGELHLNWCCEISLPIQENIDSVAIVSAVDGEKIAIVSDDEFTCSCCCC